MLEPGTKRASTAGASWDGASSGPPAAAGVSVSVAVRVAPPPTALSVTAVALGTEVVETGNVALVAPAGSVTLAGTEALALELVSVTTSPPLGAALVSVALPVAPFPPTTLVGLTPSAARLAGGGTPWTVKLRAAENGPSTPAEFVPRTRQKSVCAGSPPTLACDATTVWLKTSGAAKVLASSIWIR